MRLFESPGKALPGLLRISDHHISNNESPLAEPGANGKESENFISSTSKGLPPIAVELIARARPILAQIG